MRDPERNQVGRVCPTPRDPTLRMCHLMMAVDKSLEILKARQRSWALRQGRATDDDGYCGCADDKFFADSRTGPAT